LKTDILYKFSLSLLVIVFLSFFAFANHVINPSSPVVLNVREDVSSYYNISINNTDYGSDANITQVNFTFPSSVVFTVGTNVTSAANTTFVNSTTVISWYNDTVFVINGSFNRTFVFNATASTPGNFNITLATINGSHTILTNISILVNDTTAPATIVYINPTLNNSINVSRSSIPINVSVSDNGIVGSIVISLYNTTALRNTSMVSANNLSHYFNFTDLSDGRYWFNVSVNDTYGNHNKTATYNVTLDTTNPGITFTCDESSVNIGDTVTCSCSGSDATSGVASTSYSINPSTAETGTFNTQCTVTDYAGNSVSSSVSYTVEGSGGGGGSTGGGGSSTTPSGKQTKNIVKVTPGAATIVKNFDKALGIKQIEITVNNEANNVKITITKYDGKPAAVTKEITGKIYRYLEINTENLADKLGNAALSVQVDKAWTASKNVAKENIKIFKFKDGEWKELSTTYKGEEGSNYIYEVSLDSFSYFAIGQRIEQAQEATTGTEDTTTPTGTEESTFSKTGLIIAIVVVILAILIIGFVIMRRKN